MALYSNKTYRTEQIKWDWFFRYLSFLRWFKFYKFLFLFLFCGIFAFYGFNKQIQYVRTEWKMYSSYFGGSDFILEPGIYYTISWDDTDQDITWMEVNGITNYFANFYKICPRCWRVGGGNWWETYLPNSINIKVTAETTINIKLQDKADVGFEELLKVRTLNVEKVDFIPEGKYIDLNKMKYKWHADP